MDTCDQLSFGIFHPFPSFERPTCCEPTWLYPLREMLWVELAHETWGPILSMLCHVRGLAEWAHIACDDVSTTTTTSAASTVVSQNMSELRGFIFNHLCDYSLVSCMCPSLCSGHDVKSMRELHIMGVCRKVLETCLKHVGMFSKIFMHILGILCRLFEMGQGVGIHKEEDHRMSLMIQ